MKKESFERWIDEHRDVIEQMRQAAHELHASVNQTYDGDKPYGVHLDMVAQSVFDYGSEVCAGEADVLPMFFGAYFHDSIEDARLTYNDVVKGARQWLDDRQATMAAEIVYALTNDKGRTRAERAGECYYAGIRQTPYAPFTKLADRLANTRYSFLGTNAANCHMKEVYRREMPHFLQAITVGTEDMRFLLPQEMLLSINKLLAE